MVGRRNQKQVLISNADSIKKSNELSTSKLNQGLTLNQMQLLSYAIYSTQKDGSTTFIKADFEKKFGIEKYQTKQAKVDAQRILSIQAGLEDLENDSFEYWNVFRKMKYDNGTFTFLWDPEITPHILDLKDKYVLTDLTITAHFNSGFSWTLYDYLRGSYGCWYKSLTKDAVMKMFGVEKTKSYLENTGLLKNRVLDVAIAEINEFTELEVNYEEIKKGRSIIGFKFIWSIGKGISKATKKQVDTLQSLADIVLEDVLMYAEINDKTNRERALEIIRDFQSIKYRYLDQELGLTSSHCNNLIKKSTDNLEALNSLLELEGKEPINTKVPLLNWLEKYN